MCSPELNASAASTQQTTTNAAGGSIPLRCARYSVVSPHDLKTCSLRTSCPDHVGPAIQPPTPILFLGKCGGTRRIFSPAQSSQRFWPWCAFFGWSGFAQTNANGGTRYGKNSRSESTGRSR